MWVIISRVSRQKTNITRVEVVACGKADMHESVGGERRWTEAINGAGWMDGTGEGVACLSVHRLTLTG